MNEFKTYHPIINFIYFLLVIGFSMFFMHPFCLVISLLSAFSYSVVLRGKKMIKANLKYMLPALFLMAVINPLFNHEGATILCYLPGGNGVTMESAIYGIAAAAMIISVICWFSCYNEIMTSDKFIYLFGKAIPSLSLVISMTLGFVPKFSHQFKSAVNAQKCLGRDVTKGSIIKRVKYGTVILSSVISSALENAVETADSMKSRGYGIKGRSAFSIYNFSKRDVKALVFLAALSFHIIAGKLFGAMKFEYFPCVNQAKISAYSVSVFASYLLLCNYPLLIEIREVKKWKALKLKT